jgi:hypothetical protein
MELDSRACAAVQDRRAGEHSAIEQETAAIAGAACTFAHAVLPIDFCNFCTA